MQRLRKWSVGVAAGGALALLTAGVASAQEPTLQDSIDDLAATLDATWLILAGILVLFMQAGFALVESGFVRAKNVANILMKNVLDVSMGAIVYWAVGFGLAYGATEASGALFGFGSFFLSGFTDYPFFFFQFAFAATAATIVSGAMAERTKFAAYLCYTVVITGLIYPVVTHWVWDGAGWLTAFRDDPMGGTGMIDFAGSTVVHSVGGWAALIGAIMVGARKGRFGGRGDGVQAFPGHSLPLGVLGVFILWIGWYGFNPGSTLGLSGGLIDIAARSAVTTTLAAGAGGATAMFVSWFQHGKSDLSLTANGILGGLVGITAGTATVEPWAAVVIGIVAGLVIVYGVMLLDMLRIDDPVGAVPVHLMNGIWGTLAVGLFSSATLVEEAYGFTGVAGLLVGGGVDLLMVQAVGVVAIGAWVVVTSLAMFAVIKATVGLRVPDAEEDAGLDVYEHGMEAYPEFTGGRDPFAALTSTSTSGR